MHIHQAPRIRVCLPSLNSMAQEKNRGKGGYQFVYFSTLLQGLSMNMLPPLESASLETNPERERRKLVESGISVILPDIEDQ